MEIDETRITLAQLARFLGVLIREVITPGAGPSAGEVHPPSSPALTLEGGGYTPPEEAEKTGGRAEAYERLWQEGLDAMMGYDERAARRAVRHDADETGE